MRRLTVVNCTADTVSCHVGGNIGNADISILPMSSAALEVPMSRSALTLTPQATASKPGLDEKQSVAQQVIEVFVQLPMGARQKEVDVPAGCPWRIYRCKIARKHRQLLIIPRRDLSAFLRDIPDSVPLSCVTLPGTHDTMAFYGWPVSQCQSLETPLAVQLMRGMRVLDIRLSIKDGKLMAYHSYVPQRASFQEILATLHAFLTAPETRSETVIVSIKQEDKASELFARLVREEMGVGPGGMGMWYLDNRIPLLGEVRGKAVLFSRFGNGVGWDRGLEGMGIHPTRWPDNAYEGFTWECKNTHVRTHDWYHIPSFLSIPEKTSLSTHLLLPPSPNEENPTPTLSITFFSAGNFPLALPPAIARGFGWPRMGFGVEGVNSRVARWLMDVMGGRDEASCTSKRVGGTRIRGWTLMDFFADPETGLVALLVESNFQGRVPGQEGW